MSMSGNYFRITLDPSRTFGPGPFSRLDFLESLDGHIWAEGTIVRNLDDGLLYRIEYQEHRPMLIQVESERRFRLDPRRVVVEIGRSDNAEQ